MARFIKGKPLHFIRRQSRSETGEIGAHTYDDYNNGYPDNYKYCHCYFSFGSTASWSIAIAAVRRKKRPTCPPEASEHASRCSASDGNPIKPISGGVGAGGGRTNAKRLPSYAQQ